MSASAQSLIYIEGLRLKKGCKTMSKPNVMRSLLALKHRLESEKELLQSTSPDHALSLYHEVNRIVGAQLDRNDISKMPVGASFVENALVMFDHVKSMQTEGIQHTMVIILDSVTGFEALANVAWDDETKISMAVQVDRDMIVLDESL